MIEKDSQHWPGLHKTCTHVCARVCVFAHTHHTHIHKHTLTYEHVYFVHTHTEESLKTLSIFKNCMCLCVYSDKFMCTVYMWVPMEARGQEIPAAGVRDGGELPDMAV